MDSRTRRAVECNDRHEVTFGNYGRRDPDLISGNTGAADTPSVHDAPPSLLDCDGHPITHPRQPFGFGK